MSIMSDNWIKKMAESENMISPFIDKQVRTHNNQQILSYGLSSYGYDARVSNEFKIFTNTKPSVIDPKKFDQDCLITKITDICIIPPNSFALGATIEYFKMPRDVIAICIGKSTYARCGIIVNITPLEPECEGHITLEFSNTTPLPAKIYAGEGACQFLFFKGEQPCNTSYIDRNGRYTKQIGVTLPTV